MKKILVLLTLGIFSQTQAQVTFTPGVKAGHSASTILGLDADYRNSFYAGVYGSLNLSKVYNMQFEMLFLQQGVDNLQVTTKNYNNPNIFTVKEGNVTLNYLSLNFINKFNFKRLSLHAGPGLDVKVSKQKSLPYDYPDSQYSEPLYSNDSNVDLTFNIGLGYKINEQFGIEGRMRQGILEPIYINSINYYGYSPNFNRSFMVGVNYTFK